MAGMNQAGTKETQMFAVNQTILTTLGAAIILGFTMIDGVEYAEVRSVYAQFGSYMWPVSGLMVR